MRPFSFQLSNFLNSYKIQLCLLCKLKLVAAKEKLEIVSGAAPPPFGFLAGDSRRLRRRNGFALIQE
jgi:hypothetical protein